jgi:hypothetical protein
MYLVGFSSFYLTKTVENVDFFWTRFWIPLTRREDSFLIQTKRVNQKQASKQASVKMYRKMYTVFSVDNAL